MKIKKQKEDKHFWRSIFKYRESMNDFIIERKSSKHPQNNHEVWLSREDAITFAKFVKSSISKK